MSRSVSPGARWLAKQMRARGELPISPRQLKAAMLKGELPPPYPMKETPVDKHVEIPTAFQKKIGADLRTSSRSEPTAITPIEYGGLQEAYDHFNAELFARALPDCFITYQRRANSVGYFSADRFSGRVGKFGKHELALNPDSFIGQTDQQITQTLVHEMAHAWQHQNGTAPARGYHNKEWAAKMKSIGLQPSSTGMVGGKETGQRMSDYVIPDGPFVKSYERLAAAGWGLNLQSAHRPAPKAVANSKTKFTCHNCGANAWGKPDLEIDCRRCGIQMRAVSPSFRPIVANPSPSYEPKAVEAVEPIKRKRGRPKGSKNKLKAA